MSKSFIAVIKHGDGTFSGIEQRYHPTPSGSDRWTDGFEDNRRWQTMEMAHEMLESGFKRILKNEDLPPGVRERISELVDKK